jgi:hypothetical protein
MITMTKMSYETADGELTMGMFERWIDHKLDQEVVFGTVEEMVRFLNEEFGVESLPEA